MQRGTEVSHAYPDFIFSESQLERIKPFFPRSHGAPRVDGRRVASGIIYVIKHGLQWKEAPAEHGPHTDAVQPALSGGAGSVSSTITFTGLANKTPFDGSLMLDSTHLKAHRTAAILLKKGILHVLIGRTKGGLNSKLHAAYDGHGRPVLFLLTCPSVSKNRTGRPWPSQAA